MDDKQLLEQVLPLIGGHKNVSRTDIRPDALYITVKDTGMVDRDALETLEGVEAAELSRSRVTLWIQVQDKKDYKEKTKMDYEKMGQEILTAVGGKENVSALVHCATRLRFNLVDDDKADQKAVEAVKGVMGVRLQGGQFQVIIGQDVSHPYNVIMKICGLNDTSASAPSAGEEKKKKGNPINSVMDILAGIFTPLLPAIIGGGMITVVYTLLTMLNIISADSNTAIFLEFLGNAPIYFMPIMAAYTAAQKFNCNPFLAMGLAGAMLHPTFSGIVTAGESFSILGIAVMLATYSANALPVILAVWVMSYFDKFFNKYVPKMIRIFIAPLLTLLCGAIVGFIVVGPLGTVIAQQLTKVFQLMIDHVGWLVVTMWGAFSPLLVMTGMHYTLGGLFGTMYYMVGYEGAMMPGMLVSNVAQGAAALAVFFASKDPDTKALGASAGLTGLMGITEPALYGVNLRYKKPLIAAMIGGGAGGLFAGITSVKAYVMASPGLISLPIFIGGGSMNGFICACIAAVIAIVVSFVISFILMKAELSKIEK
ncbi:MAG: PTS transporter subunit EIIC [Eubacteriales bacterium]|nr:PTS transporter subunit EIIC [Eubacteriales bacterium]